MHAWIKPASALKVLVFCAALVPLARIATGAVWYPDWLGANPAEYITRSTGDWTLRFLLLTLAVTPLRKLTGWPRWPGSGARSACTLSSTACSICRAI